MQKRRKNSKESIAVLAVQKVLALSRALQKARGGKYRLCPNCLSLDTFPVDASGMILSGYYYCKKCGFGSYFFPEHSVKELKKIAQELLKKNKNAVKQKRKKKAKK